MIHAQPILTASLGYPYCTSLEDEKPKPTMADICRQVAERHGLTVEELRSDRRCTAYVEARWEAWTLMRRQKGKRGGHRWSLPQIGRYFHRDHGTVHHGLKRYEQRMAEGMVSLRVENLSVGSSIQTLGSVRSHG